LFDNPLEPQDTYIEYIIISSSICSLEFAETRVSGGVILPFKPVELAEDPGGKFIDLYRS